MNGRELRRKFLEFFDGKDHHRLASDSLVPDDPSLLFTSAGMVQLKPYFSGAVKPPHPRLTSCQKCLRTTDIESVGDASHLTFFEMLGNFSVYDYFKREAIEWAWEFLTDKNWLGLDPGKLCVTVFEQDDEAAALWRDVIGLPESKIHRLPEDKNFWPANAPTDGPNGPCGPCSEIFYQTVPDIEMAGDYLIDDAAGRWLEIWNLVFMQFERRSDPEDITKNVELIPLPKPCIDTGMGVDRTATVLGGFANAYEIDTMQPIMDRIAALSGKDLSEPKAQAAARIITDHLRAASFCIADGVLPQNVGRGYVLRRLIRRAVLKGQRVLGFERPFLTEVFPALVECMGDYYTELSERRAYIMRTLGAEEEAFRRTLHQGSERFQQITAQFTESWVFPGEAAFELHDTFGFPLEVTQELAEQLGGSVDTEGYERSMQEQRVRSKSGSAISEAVFHGESVLLFTAEGAKPFTPFVGYDKMDLDTRIVQVSPRFPEGDGLAAVFDIALDETPFYAESGGQVGDMGTILVLGEGGVPSPPRYTLNVIDTQRAEGIIWHQCRFEPSFGGSRQAQLEALEQGAMFQPVHARVDADRRRNTVRNHTATHLLHAALRSVLGDHVRQAGSLVSPEHMRFDFTHNHAMSPEQVQEVERIVNEWILKEIPVTIQTNVPIAEAKAMGAMALFGEKYGDAVRVVQIPDFSIELCGGCHVSNTANINLFKITHEASAASGVRRIEAVTGKGAYEWVRHREEALRQAAAAMKTSPHELLPTIEKLQGEVRELKLQLERAIAGGAARQEAAIQDVSGVSLIVQTVTGLPLSAVPQVADTLANQHEGAVIVVGGAEDGRVIFVAKVGADALGRGAHAGNLVKGIAQIAGGTGGGRPDFAQAGAKDAAKLQDALGAARRILEEQLA